MKENKQIKNSSKKYIILLISFLVIIGFAIAGLIIYENVFNEEIEVLDEIKIYFNIMGPTTNDYYNEANVISIKSKEELENLLEYFESQVEPPKRLEDVEEDDKFHWKDSEKKKQDDLRVFQALRDKYNNSFFEENSILVAIEIRTSTIVWR